MNLQQIQQDLKDFHSIASQFWKIVPDEAWQSKTGTRDKDWTLHETLAHILSIAQIFNKATDAAMRGETLTMKGMNRREDLAEWNSQQIERLAILPANSLIVQLLQEWRIANEKLEQLTPETAQLTVQAPHLNRPTRAIDFIEWQMSHAGIVHGTQITMPLEQAPLWTQFSPDLTQRMISRFIHQWSVVYWQALGTDEAQTINFHIGEMGWHLLAASDGGTYGEGIIEGGEYDLFFESADVFLGVFTSHISFREAMLNGQMRLASDVRDTLAILSLFSPKKPKQS